MNGLELQPGHQADAIFDKYLPATNGTNGTNGTSSPGAVATMSDESLIRLIRSCANGSKFDRLFVDGDTSNYDNDDSRADLALCGVVAFYSQDPNQVDRIIRASKLMRAKWDERHGAETYGQRTIRTALDGLKEKYSGNGAAAPVEQALEGYIPRARPLSDVSQEPPRWLWLGYIPAGVQVAFSGLPGEGKTTLVCDLIARQTTGGIWPDGAPVGPPRNVLIISAEDAARTLRRRIAAANGDLSRVYCLPFVSGEAGKEIPLTFPDDLPTIEGEILACDAALCIIDPIDSLMGKSDSGSSTSVRHIALTRLAAIAERTGATVLYLGHPAKAGSGKAVHSFGGSQAFVSAARAHFIVAPEKGETGRRVLACTKSNLAKTPASLAYSIESSVPGDDTAPPVIVWHGPTDATADSLVTPPERHESKAEDRARGAIVAALFEAGGKMRAPDLEREAREKGGVGVQAYKAARAALAADGTIESHSEKKFQAVTWWRLVQREGQLC